MAQNVLSISQLNEYIRPFDFTSYRGTYVRLPRPAVPY